MKTKIFDARKRQVESIVREEVMGIIRKSWRRILWTLLICLFTIYAPLELTRLVMASKRLWSTQWDIPIWQFHLEIALFWIMYLVGMVIIYKKIKE